MPYVPVLAPSGALPALYDYALNGIGFVVAWEIDRELLSPWKVAYEMDAVDELIERRDDATGQMADNKVDTFWWMTNRDWTYGTGQQRLDPTNTSYPGAQAFFDSQGIDVMSEPGIAFLLPKVSNILNLANLAPVSPQKMVATDSAVYVAGPQPHIYHFSAIDGSDAATSNSGTSTGQSVLDMATNGVNVYLALGVDGITSNSGTTYTQVDSFDSVTGWSGSTGNIVPTLDTVIFNEGTGSLKISVTGAGTGPVTASKAYTKDFSADSNFKFQLREDLSGITPVIAGPAWPGNASGGDTQSGGTACSTLTASATLPSGAVAGNTFVVEIHSGGGGDTGGPPTITNPSGFTVAGVAVNPGGQAQWTVGTFYKVLTSGDIATGTFTFTGFGTFLGIHGYVLQGSNVTLDNWSANGGGATITGTVNHDNSLVIAGGAIASYTNSFSVTYNSGAISNPNNGGGSGQDNNSNPTFTTTASATGTSNQGSFSTSWTFGSAGASQFGEVMQQSVWYSPAPLQAFEIRMQTSGGNYFTYTYLPAGSGSFTQVVIPKSSFTSVGVPDWSTITALVLAFDANPTVTATYHIDDWEVGIQTVFAVLDSADTRAIGWSKDRLYAAGIASGDTWRFFEAVGPTFTSDRLWLTLPEGYTVPAGTIQELGGFVYFGASRSSISRIYAFDGTNIPFISVEIPLGEEVTMIQPFLGAGLLIGTRRVGTMSPNAGQGVLYRAFPDSNGHLTLERIATFGVDDGNHYAPLCGTVYKEQVHFGLPRCSPETFLPPQLAPANTATTSGLGVYNPATGGFARHLEAAGVTAQVISTTIFKNRRLFTVDGVGVFIEQAQYVDSGYITSSVLDWNIDANKQVIKGEIGTLPLPAGTAAEVDYSFDKGVTWTAAAAENMTGATLATGPIFTLAQIAQWRAVLTSDAPNHLQTPILKKAGLAAVYGEKPRRVWKIATKAYNRMTLRNKTEYPGSGETLSAQIEASLQALHDSQQIVTFQPVGYGEEHSLQIPVRISALRVLRQFQMQVGWANLIMVQITEVPTT